MVITTNEYLYSRQRGLQVITHSREVEDSGFRCTIQIQIGRKRKKLYELKMERDKLFKKIQTIQKEALLTDDDLQSKVLLRSIDEVFIHQLHSLDREMKVIVRQIEDLKARL